MLVAITAPRQSRYQRLATRPIRPLTPTEAQERDIREIEHLEKGGPIAMADYTLLNDGSPERLLRELEDLLDQLAFGTMSLATSMTAVEIVCRACLPLEIDLTAAKR